MRFVSYPSTRRRARLVTPLAGLALAGLLGACATPAERASSTRDAAPAAASSSTASTTTTTTAPTTTTTTEPEPTTTTAPPIGGAIEPGAKSPEVEALQRRLVDLHFDPGPVDGSYGEATESAVWAFQKLHGLGADGVVTPELWDLIMTAGPPAPMVPDGPPNRTEVDLSIQVLQLWEGGKIRLITHVSTGASGTRTPPGSFTYYGARYDGWQHGNLGPLYNPVYFNGGIAVHGANSVPTYPASHGCVRIPMHIAEYFPSLVNTGDAVFVVRSSGESPPPPAPRPSPSPSPAPTEAPAPEPPPDTAPPVTEPPTTAPPDTTAPPTVPPTTVPTTPPTTEAPPPTTEAPPTTQTPTTEPAPPPTTEAPPTTVAEPEGLPVGGANRQAGASGG